MYNWSLNIHHHVSCITPNWLEEGDTDDEFEWLEEEYEDYDDGEPSDKKDEENIDISDADF